MGAVRRTGYEKRGIGRRFHEKMLDWAFARGQNNLWLTSDAGTRAEGFYRRAGWREAGRTPEGEFRFELHRKNRDTS